jgi:hypothetical protein
MNWDDNSTRALVAIVVAALGAIGAGILNGYAANRRIKEVELQYIYKLRDGYLDNARKLSGEVYIPINISLTKLFNNYERFAATIRVTSENVQKSYREDFETACLEYIQTIGDLMARGADAYLTTAIDEQLNDFTNFIGISLDQQAVRKRRVLQTDFGFFGMFISPALSSDDIATSRLGRASIPAFSLRTFGVRLSYSEKVLAAPLDAAEFEARIRTEIPRIKSLIKEVTLGSHRIAV